MRGDLHTLKRVCEYASKVMLVAEFVFAGLVIASAALSVAAFFSDAAEELLLGWVDADASDETFRKAASYIKFTLIWVIAFLTIKPLHDIMCTIRDEHSPFTEINTDRMIFVCFVYLAAAFVMLVLDVIIGTAVAFIAFVFLGCILISVVMYCLALICRYGAVLQKESDETL